MRKIYVLLLFAALLPSCNTTEDAGSKMGKTYTLKGTMHLDDFVWSSTADLGLYSADDNRIGNAECRIEGWQRSSP